MSGGGRRSRAFDDLLTVSRLLNFVLLCFLVPPDVRFSVVRLSRTFLQFDDYCGLPSWLYLWGAVCSLIRARLFKFTVTRTRTSDRIRPPLLTSTILGGVDESG